MPRLALRDILLWIVLLVMFQPAQAQLMPESAFRVRFNEREISVVAPTGERRTVLWSALTRVTIRTTDEGPLRPDVFWEFYAGSAEVHLSFPSGATGEREIVGALNARLLGFRINEATRAMGSTSNATFVIWERPNK